LKKFFIVHIFLLFFLTLSSFALELTDDEKAFLATHPLIKIGVRKDIYPYSALSKEGNFTGIASSFFDYFEKTLKVKFKLVAANTWEELIKLEKDHKIDLISTTFVKEPSSYLTIPLFNIPLSALTLKKDSFFQNQENYSGKKIIICNRLGLANLIKNEYSNSEIIDFKSLQHSFKALKAKEVDLIIGELFALEKLIEKEENSDYFLYLLPKTYPMQIAINHELKLLHSILQKAVLSLSEEKKESFYNLWVKNNQSKKIKISQLLLAICIISLFLLLLFLELKSTRKRKMELELANEQLKLHLKSFDIALNATNWVWNLDKGSYICSELYEKNLGYKKDEIPQTFEAFMSLVAPEDKPLLLSALKRYLEKTDSFFNLYCNLLHKDGSYQMFHSFGLVLANNEFNLPKILGGYYLPIEKDSPNKQLPFLDINSALFTRQSYSLLSKLFLKSVKKESCGAGFILIKILKQNKKIDEHSLGATIFNEISLINGCTFHMGEGLFAIFVKIKAPSLLELKAKKIIDSLSDEYNLNPKESKFSTIFIPPNSFADEQIIYKNAFKKLLI